MYTITVTSLDDSGTGTLRQALADAESYTGTDEVEIVFDTSLSGTIKLSSSLTLPSGVVVHLPEVVNINQNSYTLNVYGTLAAEWETAADAITGGGYFEIRDGGRVQLKNANITGSARVYMYSGGELEMEGGTLDRNYLYIASGATAKLNGVTVKQYINNYGTLTLSDCTLNSYLVQSGTLTINNNTFNSYLQVSSAESITGSGNVFTGNEVFRLYDYSGNTDDLAACVGSITSDSAYIGVSGNLNTAIFTKTQGGLNLGYKSVNSVSIQADNTVTLEEEVSWELNGYVLNVYGTLAAERETAADVITGSGYLYAQNGGKVQLKNANINLSGSSTQVYVYSGGVLEMEGGSLYARYVTVEAGGNMVLDGTTVKQYMQNYGTLTLTDCTVGNTLYLYSGSEATVTGCALNGTLQVSLGATTTITGNDFSNTTLKLTDLSGTDGVVDLSGNYWGTTDIDEVIAKIQNYSEDRVLITDILMAPPAQEFCFDATMAGRHRLSHLTTSLTLRFNRLVDADTVNADSILLTDADGNKVAVQKYEVSGKKVTLYFDKLETGEYRANCTAELKDADGKSFSVSENFADGIVYNCLQIEQPRVLLFRSNSTVTDVFSYVDVFFDQVMDDGTISLDAVHLYAPDGQEIELTQMRKAGVSGNVFYRFYFDTVSAKGTYTLSIDQSVCNDWGVEMSADYRQEIYVAAPDLTVGAEVNISDSVLGRYTTITYTVSNIGDAMTPGTWTDAVYLCRTPQWNEEEAILLGRYNRTEALSENGSYTASVKGLLTDSEPGDYYVFVRTDEADSLSEDNENNNVTATGTKISIEVPELTGESVNGTLSSANETLYYSFTPTESGSYNLTVDDPSATVLVTETVSGQESLNKKTSVNSSHYSVFSAEAGKTYYIAVSGGKDTNYTVQLRKSEFAVYDSSFSHLASGHSSTLTLLGSEFSEGMEVYVEDENGVRYDAERVTIVDSCQATVTFCLTEELAGGTALTLYARNEAGTVVKLDEALHTASYSDLVEVNFSNMNGERHTGRVGWVWKADLTAENKAGYDVSNAIILVTDTAEDFAMYYSYADANVRDRSALLFLGGVDALTPDVMTAGETSKLGIYVKHYRSGTGAVQAWLLAPESTEQITDAQWEYFESALRPASCSDADWSAWWSNMQPRIGNTIGDFTSFIYGMRDAVAAAGQNVNMSSLADLTAIAMTHCPDYVPGYVVQGVLTEWGTGKALSGVTVNLHKKVGDSYELIGSAETDSQGHYIIQHDGAGVYYVAVPGLDVDVDGDGYSDIGIPEFEIGEEDKDISPYIVTGADDEGGLQGQSDIEYAANGDLGRLWLVNGYLCFSTRKNGVWSENQVLRISEGLSDFALQWDETLNAYVVFWNERNETGNLDSYVQLVTADKSGSYQPSAAVQVGEDAVSHTSLQSRGNGQYLLVCNNESDISCVDIDMRDEQYWQEIEEDLTTGDPIKKSFKYPIKMPFGKNSAAEIQGSGSIDLTDPCEVVLSYSLGAGATIDFRSGQYDQNKFSVSGSLSETVKYFYTEMGEKSQTGSGSANLTVSFDSPDGLIRTLKNFTLVPVVSAIGNSLFVLKNVLSKVDIDFDLGYKIGVTFDFSWDSGEATIFKPTFTVTVYGGVEDRNGEWYARGSGEFCVSCKWNLTDMSYVSNSLTFSGSLGYEVKTPTILGWCYESSGNFDFSTNPDDIEEVSFTRKDVAKMSIVRSLVVDDTTYTITSDEQNNFSNLSITANKNGELYSVNINTAEFSRVSDLLIGRGYITDISCSTLGDYGVITVSGYVGEYFAKENVTATELMGVLDTVNYKKESCVLYVKDAQVTDKWLGIPDGAFPEGDKLQESDLDETETGKLCRVELFLQEDGKYAIYYSETQDGEWSAREKVTTCTNRPNGIDVAANAGNVAIIYTETDFSETGDGASETYMWTRTDGAWNPSTVAVDRAEETSGSTMIQTVISALGVDPWNLLNECDKKPEEEEPADELEHEAFRSYDPNDFYGPVAYGAENWIAPQEMQFQILCENEPEENIAHAAMVTIRHKVDDAYDYSTFRLGDMMIGGNYIEITESVKSYKARLDWTSTLGVLVDVNAFFDAETGEVVWEFVAIDPETGWIVSDPFSGLLAPNYNPPEGDGWVYYYVEPKETTVTGTTATSQAEIIFDYNEPIMTPVLSYTFDADKPEGAVTAVAAAGSTRYLRVDWNGTDVGSGVACYNVFVSVDGGDWELWQANISATSALYTVAEGEHHYAFFAQAIDNVGLMEDVEEMMPAEAELTAGTSISSLSVNAVQALRAGDELTLSICFSEKAVCADWAEALQVSTSAQTIDLSVGTFSYDEATDTLTWVGTVAGVPDGAQATVRLKDGTVTDAAGQAFGSTSPAYSVPVELTGVSGSTYAAPTLVDYNGDGLLDVLVGEVAENGKGRIRIYLNEGTAEVASFASFIYASTAEDTPIEVSAAGCQGAVVRFADITGDGKAEMVVGLADGTIRVFTAAENGYWADAGELSCSVGGESEPVDVGTRAALEFVDADGDGRTDMLVGTGDGNVLLYLNTSAEGAASFDAGHYLHDASGRIDVGTRATVATGDFDGDGLWDMLLGTADGTVLFYRNEGSTATPLFGTAEVIPADDAPLDMSSETNRVRIDSGDLNGDGIDDLVVGQSDGSVKVLYGTDGADLIGSVVVGSIPLPGVPQQVEVSVSGSNVTVSWESVTVEGDADVSYEVSYLAAGAETTVVVQVAGTETTLELPDGAYGVQVRALNYGKGGEWSSVQDVTVDTVAPEIPGDLNAAGGETEAELAWSAVADAASYELRYRQSGSTVWRTVTGTENGMTLDSLAPADYEWQVRAADAAGNMSEWSSVGSFTVSGVIPDTEQHWATGLLFDASGAVTGGYYDVNKSGSGDSNLCWAAADSNVLAWWQTLGMTETVVPDAPQGAEAIYATFSGAWENSSGVDAYGFIWWLSGDSTASGYDDYVKNHYLGDSSTGAYYNQYYTAQTVAQYTEQVQLSGADPTGISSVWTEIYEASGMLVLGVFRSVSSGGALSGGHSLTLWGFETDTETGTVMEIYVTDSDDDATALETLAVEYDAQTGYYTITQDGSRLNGYVLGTYTYLKAFTGKDIVNPELTVDEPVAEKLSDGCIRVTFSWSCTEAATYELTVDGKTYSMGTDSTYTMESADGEHTYSVTATDASGNVGTASGSFAMDATAPDTVSGVQVDTLETGVVVKWTTVADVATYTLQYATTADFSDAKSVEGITAATYTLTDVPGTGTLYVRVSAVDAAGNASDWSTVAQTGLDITAPVVTLNTPVLNKIADGKLSVTLSWSCSEPAVYTLTVDGTEYNVRGATSYTLELADGEHVYSVTAMDGAGLTGTASGSFAMDATAPDTVQGVQAITGGNGVAVSWTAAEDAAAYMLQYATTADFSDAKSVEGIMAASYTLTDVPGTGTLYVRVSAVDEAGNASEWSEPVQSGLDITAPDAVQGLNSLAHGTSAYLSWGEVSDASGISGYRIQYAVNGDFSEAQTMQVNGSEAIFYTLQNNTAYQWRVAAVDGAGNVGAWSAVDSFSTGDAEPEDDTAEESCEIEMSVPSGGESHNISLANGWVGFDDPADYWFFTAKGEGAYAVSLDGAALGTQVFLSVGALDENGNFTETGRLLVAPGSAATALGGIVLAQDEKCYIRVESYDKGLGRYNGEYSLSVNAEVAESACLTDNNSTDKATVLSAGGAEDAALRSWVGAGDALDYYSFELENPADVSLVLSELDAAVKVKLLREEQDGSVSQVLSRSVKAGSGLDHTLSLTSGTYFVEVASYDNGAGRYNTTYALELEKEEEEGRTERFTIANA